MLEGIWDIQSFFFIRRCSDEKRDVLSWHFVLISDRDLWLPSPVTLPLWRSRCPHFRLDWAHAGHTIVYRFPLSIQLCWTCATHTIVFGSSRTMTLEWGVNTTVFGRGVSIQRQCWNLLTGSMIRRISKQRHFYHHCNEIIVPWNQCEFLKSQEKYKRQEDVEEEFSNPMLMSWSQKRQIARS